ncbi:hypothetical protein V2J09_023817 [Rumex salicifolius]
MSDVTDFCNYHPDQLIVGVCPLCLHDKLLIIAAIQDRRSHGRLLRPTEELQQPIHSRKPSNGGLLTFGSLLSRLELRRSHRRSDYRESCNFDDDCGAGSGSQSDSLSLEDSFISIKLEEHGDANSTSVGAINTKALYKEGNWKSGGGGSLRWRKRIGQLLQLVKRKRFKNPNGDAGIVKVMNMK